jgi:16S rRNA (uracil1498-N3)-methyltransferase
LKVPPENTAALAGGRMSERFYVNGPLAEGATVEIAGPEARHLAIVCRLRPGAGVCLFNGDGHEYPARVLTVERRQVTLTVEGRVTPGTELAFHLELAVPLPRGDRAQVLVEKLTELGVTRFVPLATRRSIIQPGEARLERLQRYVIEASKQCGRNRLMEVGPVMQWPAFCAGVQPEAVKVVAHPARFRIADVGTPLSALKLLPGQRLVAAVGPEGGFTDLEIELAGAQGWRTLDLGPRILRLETAALLLAAWASAVNGWQAPAAE